MTDISLNNILLDTIQNNLLIDTSLNETFLNETFLNENIILQLNPSVNILPLPPTPQTHLTSRTMSSPYTRHLIHSHHPQ